MRGAAFQKGFTIVELLIVIVVIAILASVSVTAYSGIQDRAENANRVADIKKMQNLLLQYIAINGAPSLYALVPVNDYYCLGQGWVDVHPGSEESCYTYQETNYAGDFEPTSAALNNALAELGNISISSIPGARQDGEYDYNGTHYVWWSESSSAQYYPWRSNVIVDGLPSAGHLWYMLDGENVDCGTRPVIRYVSGSYSSSQGYVNSGYSSGATTCLINIPA